jgi:hypothetical protein
MCFPKSHGFVETPEWEGYDSKIRASDMMAQDVHVRLFLPTSRIFSYTQPIPFHVAFTSSAYALAAFMPFAPAPGYGRQVTRISVVRQSTCDVRNEIVEGTRSDMWRTDIVGEGVFQHAVRLSLLPLVIGMIYDV